MHLTDPGRHNFALLSHSRPGSVPRSPRADPLPGPISCVTDAKRIWHYALTILLPTLGVKTRTGEPLHEALYHSATLELAVFYATLTGGAAQRVILTQSPEDSRVLLIAQGKTAEAVRASLERGILTNGTLFAIMSLAIKQNQYSASLPVEKRYQGAFSSPVQNIGGLDWLGQLQYAPEHASMWPRLLRSRSSGITHPGLNDYLQLSDLYRASLSLTKPEMELQSRAMLPWDNDAIHSPQLWELEGFEAHSELKDIVLDMRHCCQLIKNITEAGDDPEYFIRHRNSVQHRLLCLPQDRDKLALHATMIFSYGAIFPISDPQPMGKLTKKLSFGILDPKLVASHSEEFLLWASMIGGISAWGGEFQAVFTLIVAQQAELLGVSDWNEAVPILEKFLWLDQACDNGGRLIWEQALASTETGI
ncbi:Fc.00g048420.m01.CDS01 [Cosmosporella sp. VM-42]